MKHLPQANIKLTSSILPNKPVLRKLISTCCCGSKNKAVHDTHIKDRSCFPSFLIYLFSFLFLWLLFGWESVHAFPELLCNIDWMICIFTLGTPSWSEGRIQLYRTNCKWPQRTFLIVWHFRSVENVWYCLERTLVFTSGVKIDQSVATVARNQPIESVID